MQDLVPQPEIEQRPPALGAWTLSHWTTRNITLPERNKKHPMSFEDLEEKYLIFFIFIS